METTPLPPGARPRPWLPRFLAVWAGQAASQFGSQVAQFALVWWITQTTNSAIALTGATLAAIVPSVVVMPFAGALVDRWNRRRVMLVTDAISAVVALGLVGLFVTGAIHVWHVYAALLVRATAGAFQFPAMQASTTELVPEARLTRVGGMNQLLQGALGILAPAAGALALSLAPISVAMGIDVLTALVALVPLLFIQIPQPPRAPGQANAPASLLTDLREGVAVLGANRGLIYVAGIASLLNFLLTPTVALAPLLITRHFGGGAPELAAVEAAGGIGLVLGGLAMSVWGGFRRMVYTALMGAIGIGTGIGMIGLAPAWGFGFAIAGMLCASVMQAFANGAALALFQTEIPRHAQGRVIALLGTVSMAIAPLSLVIAGPFAEAFGPRPWFVAAGALSVIVSVSGLFSREARQLGAARDVQAASSAHRA